MESGVLILSSPSVSGINFTRSFPSLDSKEAASAAAASAAAPAAAAADDDDDGDDDDNNSSNDDYDYSFPLSWWTWC